MDDLKNLVVRAQGRDLDAYSTLVRRFQDMAVGYAFSILGDFHLAEDAAQEAAEEGFAAAIREQGGYDDDGYSIDTAGGESARD